MVETHEVENDAATQIEAVSEGVQDASEFWEQDGGLARPLSDSLVFMEAEIRSDEGAEPEAVTVDEMDAVAEVLEEIAAPESDDAVQESDDAALVAELREQVSAAQAQSALAREKYMRLAADYDNYKKRCQRENDNYKKRETERIVLDFLGVMDNLERALAHAKQCDTTESLLQGVELVQRLYAGVLSKYGCEPFESLGQRFNPDFHDAFHRVIDSEVPDNTIVEELQRGYKMNEHVLRPSLVVVSRCEEVE